MRRSAAAIGALALLVSMPAAGCDFGCFDGGAVSLARPIPRPVVQPAPRPAPRATPRPAPQPASVAASLGLHRVTQVWAGDVVTRSGPVTTYSSLTVQQSAGTYAKQVATAATGQKTSYDAVLSNPRATLTDGRAVSGDIYANYVWTGSSLQLDRYVFFQSDREVARVATPAPATAAAPARPPSPTPPPAPTHTVPYAAPAATARPAATPRPTPTPTPRVVRAGIALGAQGDTLARIEVLRGRRVDLWARATVNGAPARVLSWRLITGEVSALGAVAGGGDTPLAGMWEAVRPAAHPYELRFAVTVEVPGEAPRAAEAAIAVVVRSPALVE